MFPPLILSSLLLIQKTTTVQTENTLRKNISNSISNQRLFSIEVFAQKSFMPWSIAWTDKDRI